MKIRPFLLLAFGLGPLAVSAVPALTVDYANLDYDNLATDTVDCSAKLTWTAGTAVDIQRRKGNEAAWTTLAEGDDSGEYLDTTVIPTERLEEEMKTLYKGIDLLKPPVCRDIIIQHFRDGVTFKQIASHMGVSETTVYKYLRSALSQLRTHLKKQ